MDNLESKVADAILERETDSIMIDGIEYPIGQPTAGTLILVSELVSEMPDITENPNNYYHEVLRVAKDLPMLGRVVATLILGAKRIKERRKVTVFKTTETKRHWSWREFRMITTPVTASEAKLEIDYLAERLIDEIGSEKLLKIVAKRLGMMQIRDFFELTTFLSAANRLKPTREVETVSGE